MEYYGNMFIKNSVKLIFTVLISMSLVMLCTHHWSRAQEQNLEINLIYKQFIWKPFSAAIVSQNDTDLDILVVTDVNDKLWSRAFLPIQINSTNNNSLLFNLDYASNSSVGNATFLAEIRDNSSKFLWSSPLNDTSGQLSNKTFTLPSNILNRPLEFRLYIITNSPGEHTLSVKKAAVTIL